MSFSHYSVSVAGAALAASSGFSAAFGASLIHDILKTSSAEEPDYRKLLARAGMLGLGGLCVVFSGFTFAPRIIRGLWMA